MSQRALSRREKIRIVVGVATAAALCVGGVALAHADGFWINTTDSMPVGLWRQSASHLARRGDVVLLCLPLTPVTQIGWARGYIAAGSCPTGQEILLKPIAAMSGDEVDVTRERISVNGTEIPNSGQLARDSEGRPMPAYPAGAYRVPASQLWLVSPHNPRSFDSRYFGPVPASLVRSTVRPVWVIG